MKSRHELISSSCSKSTKYNVERARRLMTHYASHHNVDDPKTVTPFSSELVLNLLATYCKFDTIYALKNETMGAFIQGLRILYEENGHTTAWTVMNGSACENPLINNRDIGKLRSAHRIN